MKTKFLLTSILTALSVGVANASGVDCTKFYVGGELGYNKFNYASEFKQALKNNNATGKSKVPTAGVLAGAKLGNFGVELDYTFYKKVKIIEQDSSSNTNLKFRNISFDMLGYFPMDRINFIASIGIGRMKFKDNFDSSDKKLTSA